jgi:uncharacterized membrane protein
MDRVDRLVEDYLGAVSYACADLPPDRRDELVGDLREHIAAARAVLYQPTEAAVRTILDRLGEPAVIAEEARLAEGFGPSATVAPPARGLDRPAHRNRLISRPMSPVTFAILLAFVLSLVAFMVLSAIMALSRGEPPMLPGR